MVGFFVFLFIFLFACSSIVNAGQWKLTVRIDGNIYWAIHCVGGLGKLVVGGKCASSGPQNRFYIWKLIVGCCRRLYFLRLPFCWQSWGCDNCRAGCNVVSEYAALLQVLQLSLDFSLVNCPLQRGRGGGALWMLVAQLLFCQKPVIHLFLGCEPRLHSSLPHTGYKDIVSFCGAAQTWVLQKCCLICFWFEVSSRVIVERKATAIMGVDSKG